MLKTSLSLRDLHFCNRAKQRGFYLLGILLSAGLCALTLFVLCLALHLCMSAVGNCGGGGLLIELFVVAVFDVLTILHNFFLSRGTCRQKNYLTVKVVFIHAP